LIESIDGRIRVCTASPETAVEHYKALRSRGIEATISDIAGRNYTLKSLHRHADWRARQIEGARRDDMSGWRGAES
jgi:hypothetical protein